MKLNCKNFVVTGFFWPVVGKMIESFVLRSRCIQGTSRFSKIASFVVRQAPLIASIVSSF